MTVTVEDIQQIKEILREDYDDNAIDDMLNKATFLKTSEGVTVVYDNGVEDYFNYKKVLTHTGNSNTKIK